MYTLHNDTLHTVRAHGAPLERRLQFYLQSPHSLLDLSFERVFELRHLIVQLPLLLLLCLLFIFILSAALHESESHLLCFGLALSGSPTTAAAAAAAAAVAVAVAVECRAEWAAQLFVPHSKQYTHTHTL